MSAANTDTFFLHTNASNHSSYPLTPSVSVDQIQKWVTIVVTVLVVIVFCCVYVQLSVVLCYGYKLVSYQTVFLFNILFWASFRLTFNSFYFYYCCDLIATVSSTSKWVLISFPEVLLFVSLALLVHYFMEHLIRVLEKRHESHSILNPLHRRFKYYRYIASIIWGLVILLYILISISYLAPLDDSLRIARVVVMELLVLTMGLVLGVCILVIYVSRAGKDIMDAKQVSKWQAITISALLFLLFSSRAIYNIVAVGLQRRKKLVSFFKFATDLADFSMTSEGSISFFCVLLLWEVIPICLIVLFFRIRVPLPSFRSCTKYRSSPKHSGLTRHFFTGPTGGGTSSRNRANHDIGHQSSHVSIPSLPGRSFSSAGYGSTAHSHFSVPTVGYNPPSFMPGTTPPKLFTGSPSVFSDSRVNEHKNNNHHGFTIND